MRVGKLIGVALLIAGCGGGTESPRGLGGAGGGMTASIGVGQGGQTALHRGESLDGTGGASVGPGRIISSQGGNGGSVLPVSGAGGTSSAAALAGHSGSGPGQGSVGGSGPSPSGGTVGSGGSGSGGRAVAASGGAGGRGGQGGVTAAGGQPVSSAGGAGGVAGAPGSAGQGGGGAGGAPAAVVTCNAVTCPTGCCDGARCVTTPTTQQCGLAGAACQACAACQRCSSSGACELDPQSRWQMFAVSATLAPLYSDGSPWDGPRDLYGGALPDPLVRFEMPVGTAVGYTDTIVDTLAPMWNQAVIPAASAVRASDLLAGGTSWSLLVGDEDADNYADVMCEIPGPLVPADFAAGAFGRTGVNACLTLAMRLVCAM